MEPKRPQDGDLCRVLDEDVAPKAWATPGSIVELIDTINWNYIVNARLVFGESLRPDLTVLTFLWRELEPLNKEDNP